MKKTLVFLASALFVALFAASCNNNSTPSETDGIDELIEEAVFEEGPVEDKALTDGMWVDNEIGSPYIYIFNEDGTCLHIRPNVIDDGIDTTKWNYTIDGETMKLEAKGEDFSMSKEVGFKINGNKLTITEAGFPSYYEWQEAK